MNVHYNERISYIQMVVGVAREIFRLQVMAQITQIIIIFLAIMLNMPSMLRTFPNRVF